MASGMSKRPPPLRALHRGSPAGVRSAVPPDGRAITSWSVEPPPPDGTDGSTPAPSPVPLPLPSVSATDAAAGALAHPCFADGVYTAPTSGLYALTLAIIPVGSACLAAGLGAPRSAVDLFVRVVAANGADVAAYDVGPVSWGEVLHLSAGSRVSVVRWGGRGDALRLCIELLQRKRRPPGEKAGGDGEGPRVKRPRVGGGNAPAQEGGAFRGVAAPPPAPASAAAEVALAAASLTAVAPATAASVGGREPRPKRSRQRRRAAAATTTATATAAAAAAPRAPSPSPTASPPAAAVAAVDTEDGPPDADEEGDDDSWDAAFESSPSGEDEALSVRGVNALARELRTRV